MCWGQKRALFTFMVTITLGLGRVGSEYSAIVSVCGAMDSKLIVLFEDGLLEMLELPSLKVLDTLSGMYLGCLPGERLVSIYVDEPGGLPYLYLGTSIGGFHVVDVSSSFSIRICEYNMPSFWNGLD